MPKLWWLLKQENENEDTIFESTFSLALNVKHHNYDQVSVLESRIRKYKTWQENELMFEWILKTDKALMPWIFSHLLNSLTSSSFSLSWPRTTTGWELRSVMICANNLASSLLRRSMWLPLWAPSVTRPDAFDCTPIVQILLSYIFGRSKYSPTLYFGPKWSSLGPCGDQTSDFIKKRY